MLLAQRKLRQTVGSVVPNFFTTAEVKQTSVSPHLTPAWVIIAARHIFCKQFLKKKTVDYIRFCMECGAGHKAEPACCRSCGQEISKEDVSSAPKFVDTE